MLLSFKSLGLLSNLCAEETPKVASVPRLNSAAQPMKTSVLRQRKGSVRKQQTGNKEAEDGGRERCNISAPQSRNVSRIKNSLIDQESESPDEDSS